MESVISDISLPLISRPTWAITVGPLRSDNSPTLSSLVPFFSGLHIYGRLSRARSIYIEDCLFKSERDERAQKGVGRGYAWRPGKIQQSSQVNENHIRLDIPYSHRNNWIVSWRKSESRSRMRECRGGNRQIMACYRLWSGQLDNVRWRLRSYIYDR